MVRAFDVDQDKLVHALAKELKDSKILVAVPWAKFVKTGVSRDRPPATDAWWYDRGASILRHFYTDNKPMGVGRLRRVYGDKEKNRYSGRHFKPAGGAAIRKILQQLENGALIKKIKVENHFGRRITPKGVSFVDNAAKKLGNI
jgi:small subunit ribosomal protein S19e